MKEIIVRLWPDGTAQISWYGGHKLIKEKNRINAAKAMIWMVKTNYSWTWEKDPNISKDWAWCEIESEL